MDIAVKNRVVDGLEARQNRHQEGGTEHGDDVLCADTGGAHPSQTFIGLDYLAGRQRLAVAMQLPLEDIGHYGSPRSPAWGTGIHNQPHHAPF